MIRPSRLQAFRPPSPSQAAHPHRGLTLSVEVEEAGFLFLLDRSVKTHRSSREKLGHHSRDVVRASSGVGEPYQLLTGILQAGRLRNRAVDLIGAHQTVEPVRAQQDDVTRVQGHAA